jgi:hypothetical protein
MTKEKIFNESEIIDILAEITEGKYSKEATYDSLDQLMAKLGIRGFSREDTYSLNTRQVQIILNVLNKLVQKVGK